MTRRNAWIGRPKEIVGGPESADVLMTSTEQFAAAENHVTFVEPQCEAADAPRRGLIDVSNIQEERPKKRPRLASFPSFVRRLSKFVLGLSPIRVDCGFKKAKSSIEKGCMTEIWVKISTIRI